MFRSEFNEAKKLWKGVDSPPFYNQSISLGHVVLRSLKVNGSKCAQISHDNGIRITYNEMYIKTIRAAQNMQKLGCKPKDVVEIIASNDHHLAPIVYASFCLGCPVNALDKSLGKNDIQHMLNITKPRLVFCDVDVCDLVAECLSELGIGAKIYTFGGQTKNSGAVENLFTETGEEKNFMPVMIDGQKEIAVIVSSSGTTGNSKGVSVSHAAFTDQQYQFSNLLSADDVIFSYSTLHWISGWMCFLMGTLVGATRVITKQKPSAEFQLRLIEEYKITCVLNGTHHMVALAKSEALKKANLTSVKIYAVGGSKIPFDLATKLSSYLPDGKVSSFYGLSELGGIASIELTETPGSVGKLLPNINVKIIDDDGNRCEIGVDGEICIKCRNDFLGYYGNQEATNDLLDGEGFIKTGDIGRFDHSGSLHIVDRKKELLKYCNFQIVPSEIEMFLMNVPNIKSVCIVGLPDPDNLGDLLAAVVVRNDNSKTTEQEISNIVAENFVDCKRLRGGVYFAESLPMTPSGKIQRRFVKEHVIKMCTKA